MNDSTYTPTPPTSTVEPPEALVIPTTGLVWTRRKMTDGQHLYAPEQVSSPPRWVMETADTLIGTYDAVPVSAPAEVTL